MGALAGALGGGGMNMLKRGLIDEPKEIKQRNLAATTALYSPWTQMSIGEVGGIPNEGSYFESFMKGAGPGAKFGQSNPNFFGGGKPLEGMSGDDYFMKYGMGGAGK